jgi:hypothetical protein
MAADAPSRAAEPLPSSGELEPGMAYSLTLWCFAPVNVGGRREVVPSAAASGPDAFPGIVGGTWLVFDYDQPQVEYPPRSDEGPSWWPFRSVAQPYPMPGVLTMVSGTRAVWVADSDRSEWHLTATPHSEVQEGGCL